MKIRRIVIIAAAVFLAGILSWVGYGYYEDYKSDPMREVVIEVNGVPFTMEYFVNTLGIYVNDYINTYLDFYMQAYNYTREQTIQLLTSNLRQNTDNIADMITGQAADEIIKAELLRQGAKNLSIEVTPEEIDARLEEYDFPNGRAYRDMIRAILLQERLKQYFDPGLNVTMEQTRVQVVLVESEEVAVEVITEIETGGNFTDLVEEFSCNPVVEGDLGWLPRELMPNNLIADVSFNLTPGEISQPIDDKTAVKNVGYWLIEVMAEEEDEIEVRAMLLGSEAEAEWVKDELVSANFSSLAKKYSQHESKINGGELGRLKQGDMGSEVFDIVAFTLAPGKISMPVKDESVQTTGGYWLVKVIERGEHDLTPNAKKRLIGKHLNDWFEELRENSTIENLLNNEKKAWAVSRVLEGR
jgi:parvulin-like peptidyl-prolyl isomerase